MLLKGRSCTSVQGHFQNFATYLCITHHGLINLKSRRAQCHALLVLRDCPGLKFLPRGIEHLAGLEELRLEEPSEELLKELQQKGKPNVCREDLLKISHIRKVTVEHTKKGISERIR